MPPISNQDVSSARNDGETGDAALQALIPFSGAYSPAEVRGWMAGPILNGPPATIWRRTTICHSNADGLFSLYACERTGKAMWVPTGEYFVADRPRGAQPVGTVMDYLFCPRTQGNRPEGYGFYHTSRAVSGENGNIRGSRNSNAGMVQRSETARATRLRRFNPLAREEPAAAGNGSRRTVARRERREKARELRNPPSAPPPPPPLTSVPATSLTMAAGDNSQSNGNGRDTDGRTRRGSGSESVHGSDNGGGSDNGSGRDSGVSVNGDSGSGSTASSSAPSREIQSTIVIHNSNSTISGHVAPQMANLDLWDSLSEDD